MKSLSYHEKQLLLQLLNQQGQIKYIFDEFVRQSGLVLASWTEKNTNNVWIRNSILEKKIDKLLEDLHQKLLKNIDTHTVDAWESANLKTDDLLKSFIKDIPLSEIVGKGQYEKLEQGMFARNMDALRAFQQRTINGLTISDRVWTSVNAAKENIEYYLSSNIATGQPASKIAQDIRYLLKDPNKRFRRIRNDEGKLILSKPMKNYHPGQGQYRSSYKNALRIAATETNQSYRLSDHERWKKEDYILGIEVHRSKSNRGSCPVCDAMQGQYPKDFKFVGWHPWCICFAVPVMLEGQDFTDYLISGKVPQDKCIKEIPQKAIDFVNEKETNRQNLFVKENLNYFSI